MAQHDVVAPEDVLESLMNDGTVDAIRMKVISQLKANVSSLPSSSYSLLMIIAILGFVYVPDKQAPSGTIIDSK